MESYAYKVLNQTSGLINEEKLMELACVYLDIVAGQAEICSGQ